MCIKYVAKVTFEEVEDQIPELGFNYGQSSKPVHTGLNHGYRKRCRTS